MRRVASPVTVVTAGGPGPMRGITIGSFTSVSLEPPLISFNVQHDAQMHGVIMDCARFAVHILSEEQAYLSEHFAVPDRGGEEQFEGIAYHLDLHGTPILTGVLAILHCTPHGTLEAGDHTIIVGEVVALEEGVEGGPVLYYDRSYRGIGPEVQSILFSPTNRVSSDAP